MSVFKDKVRELWNDTPDDRRFDVIVDALTEELEALRAELEAVRSRRLTGRPPDGVYVRAQGGSATSGPDRSAEEG